MNLILKPKADLCLCLVDMLKKEIRGEQTQLFCDLSLKMVRNLMPDSGQGITMYV